MAVSKPAHQAGVLGKAGQGLSELTASRSIHTVPDGTPHALTIYHIFTHRYACFKTLLRPPCSLGTSFL